MTIFTNKWLLILRQNIEALHLLTNLLWFSFSCSLCQKFLINPNPPWDKSSTNIFIICGYFLIISATLSIWLNGGNLTKLPNWLSITFLIFKPLLKCLKKSQKSSLNVTKNQNNILLKESWQNNLLHIILILWWTVSDNQIFVSDGSCYIEKQLSKN